MTLYEQIQYEKQIAKAALDRIYQPLPYAVPRVIIQRPNRAFGKCAVRVEKPKGPSIAPDAVLQAVETVRQSKDRGS